MSTPSSRVLDYRHKLLYLVDALPMKGAIALDVGCGGEEQHFFEDFYIQRAGFDRVIGIDPHLPWIEWRRRQYGNNPDFGWVCTKAEDFEIKWSFVLCTIHHVIEHIEPNAASALMERLKDHCEVIFIETPDQYEDGQGAVKTSSNPWMAHECLVTENALGDRGFKKVYTLQAGIYTNSGYIWRKK